MGGRGASSVTASNKFTDREQEAIDYYVSGDGMYLNNVLRGRDGMTMDDLTTDDRATMAALDSALSKTVDDAVLYRSVDASAIFGSDVDLYDLQQEVLYRAYSGAKGAYSQKKAAEINNKINSVVGKTMTDKGYVSTTRDASIAENWGGFTGSENPVVMKIKTSKKTKGANVSKATENLRKSEKADPQKETLLARNQQYKITKVYAHNGTVYVDVQM